MLSAETKEFLESGCALIVATVSGENEPFASRAWGLDVLDDEEDRVRLLLEAEGGQAVANLRETGMIAVTAANVPTLHSMQLKGRALRVVPATADDHRRSERYCDEFFADIEATDGTERRLLERWRPRELVACEIAVEELYDQTPGPSAGAELS